eukprot:487549_1
MSSNRSGFGRLGPLAVSVDDYVNAQRNALQSHLELDDADRKLKWKIYRWAVNSEDVHHGVAVMLFDDNNPNKDTIHQSFSIELIFDPQNKKRVSLYIYMETKDKKDTRKIQKGNLFYGTIIHNKSLNDILNISKQCIGSWREYHPIFFNCRHFVARLMNMLQDKQPDPWISQIGEKLKLLAVLGVVMTYVLRKKGFALVHPFAQIPFDLCRRDTIGRLIAGLARNYYQKNGGNNLYRNIGLSLGWFVLIQFGIDKLLRRIKIKQHIKTSDQMLYCVMHLGIYFWMEATFFKQIQVQNEDQSKSLCEV